MRTIIADDNEMHRNKLIKFFSKFGYVYDTHDGNNAVSAFKRNLSEKRYDLIVLDNLMPYSGMDAIMEIRAEEKKRMTPPSVIFMISGFEDEEEKAEAFRKGADEYFVKGKGCTLGILKEAMKKYGLVK